MLYTTESFRMILSDSKIFNDTKRRAVSQQQLSFLFLYLLPQNCLLAVDCVHESSIL